MFTKGVVILTLLYLNRASVNLALNHTDSNREPGRMCCARNIDVINDHEIRCDFNERSYTSIAIPYDTFDGNVSAISCCTTCLQIQGIGVGERCLKELKIVVRHISEFFGMEYRPEGAEDGQEHVSVEATPDTEGSCFEACSFNNHQVTRVEQERNSNGRDDVNDTVVKIDKSPGNETQPWHCDSVFTSLKFWGANIVIFANAIYIVPYMVVVVIYFAVPGLGTRAYNKAVLCYNASQIILNSILIGIGVCALCHVSICSHVYILAGLTIMYLMISSAFWLFVICIDMTLVITRFRWASPSDSNHQQEKKKFSTYAIWIWGGSLLPTIVACIAELSPLLPKSSPIRPNFEKFEDGANLAVILYTLTFPALTCLANTALFCYTTYKMILIRKSTMLAAANSTLNMNTAKKRYFPFIRLYLLMDAPWITSGLAAVYTDLWLLKFLRMIQPILMLLAILPPRMMSRAFRCRCLPQKSNRTLNLAGTP